MQLIRRVGTVFEIFLQRGFKVDHICLGKGMRTIPVLIYLYRHSVHYSVTLHVTFNRVVAA